MLYLYHHNLHHIFCFFSLVYNEFLDFVNREGQHNRPGLYKQISNCASSGFRGYRERKLDLIKLHSIAWKAKFLKRENGFVDIWWNVRNAIFNYRKWRKKYVELVVKNLSDIQKWGKDDIRYRWLKIMLEDDASTPREEVSDEEEEEKKEEE